MTRRLRRADQSVLRDNYHPVEAALERIIFDSTRQTLSSHAFLSDITLAGIQRVDI